jgi:uncharacterized membrane protein YsdA (DUF1294 family)
MTHRTLDLLAMLGLVPIFVMAFYRRTASYKKYREREAQIWVIRVMLFAALAVECLCLLLR